MAKGKIVEVLPVILTEEEAKAKAKALARKLREIGTLEAAAKDAAAEARKEIKAAQATADLLAHEVDTGKESRPVECYEVPNLEAKTMELYREDTGELVRTRSMDYEDRQEHLPLSTVKPSRKAGTDRH